MSLISKQWDVGASVFQTVSGPWALTEALSKEEFHMQAVFAIESIGSKLIVAPELIGEGVMVLKGIESVRLASMKLLVGIQAAGLVSKLRESSTCVRTFLLIAALKACAYEEKETANIMITAGLLDAVAVAPRQLRDLVKAVSGHTETLFDLVLQTQVKTVEALSTRDDNQCTQTHWQKIADKDPGKLLAHAFDAIQCDDYDFTELCGSIGLIGLATILL